MNDQDKKLRRPSLPTWCRGVLVGIAIWLAAFVGLSAIERFETILPDWLGWVQMLCALITLPVMSGGWLFMWGDDGAPFEWMRSPWINVAFGLTLCSFLGAATAVLIKKWRR